MKAYDLVDEPEKWCQGGCAEKANGQPCFYYDNGAVKFCALGAIWRTYGAISQSDDLIKKLSDRVGGPVSLWNDDPKRTQAEVYAALKELDI